MSAVTNDSIKRYLWGFITVKRWSGTATLRATSVYIHFPRFTLCFALAVPRP